MTGRMEIYKCEVCGNIVEMLHTGVGTMVCCDEPMKLYKENTKEAAVEKHIPVASANNDSISVKVGSVTHPMEETHFIEWIEVMSGDKSARQFLSPGQAPAAEFNFQGGNITARAYCNIHGLWKN